MKERPGGVREGGRILQQTGVERKINTKMFMADIGEQVLPSTNLLITAKYNVHVISMLVVPRCRHSVLQEQWPSYHIGKRAFPLPRGLGQRRLYSSLPIAIKHN